MQLWSTGGKIGLRAPGARGPLSYQQVQDVSGLNQDLSGVAAFTERRYNLTGQGEPREVQAILASPSLFDLLGVQPAIGRGFSPSDLHEPVVVLSHGLWLQLFGGDASAVGRVVTLDGNGYTLVGVMPAGFAFPDDGTQLWTPLGQAFVAQPEMETNPDFQALNTVARLGDGVDMQRLESDLAVVAARQRAFPGLRPPGFATMRLRDEAVGDARTPLLVLLAVAGVVLMIGCVNAANLLLARAGARQREFAVRRALGAGRGRLVGQLLTESVAPGPGRRRGGASLAEAGVPAILRAWPSVLPRTHQIGLDAATLVYALLISLIAGIAFGLAPAWRSSAVALETALRGGSSTSTPGPGRHRLQRGLVVAEISLALVVLTGAGLLVRSFVRLRSVDPGYDVHEVLAARIRLTPSRYDAEAQKLDFYLRVVDAAQRQPGVASASASLTLPMSGEVAGFRWSLDNPGDYVDIDQDIVTPDFFRTLRIPLLAGRTFTEDDRDNTQLVAIVNAALASRLWPNQSPIGQTMHLRAGPTLIIGEIGNIRYASLTDPVKAEIYLPFAQGHAEFQRRPEMSAWLVARSTHDPLALAGAVRTGGRGGRSEAARGCVHDPQRIGEPVHGGAQLQHDARGRLRAARPRAGRGGHLRRDGVRSAAADSGDRRAPRPWGRPPARAWPGPGGNRGDGRDRHRHRLRGCAGCHAGAGEPSLRRLRHRQRDLRRHHPGPRGGGAAGRPAPCAPGRTHRPGAGAEVRVDLRSERQGVQRLTRRPCRSSRAGRSPGRLQGRKRECVLVAQSACGLTNDRSRPWSEGRSASINQMPGGTVRERQQPPRERYQQIGFQRTRCQVSMEPAAGTDPALLDKLMAAAEHSCINLQTLRADVPVEATVVIPGQRPS